MTIDFYNIGNHHGVWKSQKTSHSTLKAKQATFTFWVDKKSLKMPKKVNFDKFWKPYAYSQTVLPDMTGQFQKDKNGLKIPKSNETFRVIFKSVNIPLNICCKLFQRSVYWDNKFQLFLKEFDWRCSQCI